MTDSIPTGSNNNSLDALAYLTQDTPGIGGKIKLRPTDFFVEELPLYEPSGQGEHLYLFIEKSNIATMEVTRQLAKIFNVRKGVIGYAGLKDKQAVTRQHFSVQLPGKESKDKELLAQFENSPLKLIWAMRHGNKLQRGHLAGNRFVIFVRDVSIRAVVNAKQLLDRLALTGVPNYFGAQRFGYRGDNGQLGKFYLQKNWQNFLDQLLGRPIAEETEQMQNARKAYENRDLTTAWQTWPHQLRTHLQVLDALRNGKSAEDAVRRIDRDHVEFLMTALQSEMFNDQLDQRIRSQTLDKILPGDLAWKHDSRAVFAVDQATADLENAPGGRVSKLEVSPSGAMWGFKMTRASGKIDEQEIAALTRQGLSLDDPECLSRLGTGERRAMRTTLTNPDIAAGGDEHGPYIRLEFTLPRGSFATVVLREIMKSNAAQQAEESVPVE